MTDGGSPVEDLGFPLKAKSPGICRTVVECVVVNENLAMDIDAEQERVQDITAQLQNELRVLAAKTREQSDNS